MLINKMLLLCTTFLCTHAFADHIRLIHVKGESSKSFEPDLAHVNISIWGKGENAKVSQLLAQDQYNQLKKTLDNFKIKATDIQTTNYDINPEYQYDNRTQTNKIVGYNVNQTVKVTLHEVKSIGKFFDDLIIDTKNLKAGINVQGVNWDIEKRDEIQKTLVKDAVQVAMEDADTLAKAAHVKIKGIYTLAPEGVATNPPPIFQGEMMMLKSAERASSPTQLFSGEVKIKATVLASFEIE